MDCLNHVKGNAIPDPPSTCVLGCCPAQIPWGPTAIPLPGRSGAHPYAGPRTSDPHMLDLPNHAVQYGGASASDRDAWFWEPDPRIDDSGVDPVIWPDLTPWQPQEETLPDDLTNCTGTLSADDDTSDLEEMNMTAHDGDDPWSASRDTPMGGAETGGPRITPEQGILDAQTAIPVPTINYSPADLETPQT